MKLVLHGYLKYKKAFFVFYIDFYFGFLLVIGVYNFQTKISEVPKVRFLIFKKKYKRKGCTMFYKRYLRDALVASSCPTSSAIRPMRNGLSFLLGNIFVLMRLQINISTSKLPQARNSVTIYLSLHQYSSHCPTFFWYI